ncbi:U3 small nucleolar RNA-associated protein 6 [Nematocida minor]|uniref:U3 small nucleolar RNA-associated protein 6 n=1 Tax=Nematocida minor TaxID=1912983 RepID=UPI00221E62AD|nr:U3 small nucleolar RNA-associated protein 6 [Nematocida minor]KAI5189380.1 U3 small nucleolar RNA-associated protein 6 [Nematocida minor]
MAQTVVNELEYMAAELNYYKDRKIFKPQELESIVKKRKEFEEILSVRPRLSVFLLYIEYEVKLQRIYNKRVKKEKHRKGYIQTRINSIYRRAQFSFPHEKELYISHLEYFISINDEIKIKELSLSLPKKLTGEPKAWILSASSLRSIGEIESSRILLQRSLRVLKNKEEIINAFIKLEEEYPEADSEKIIEILKRQTITSSAEQ